jgi:hypothetical protein
LDPRFVQLLPRIDAASFKPAAIFEIDLPRERVDVLDDRPAISGELVDREAKAQAAAEIAAYRKAIGWDK